MIAIVAKFPVKPEKVEEAVAAIKALMVEVAKEEGTLMYTLCRDKKDPNMLVFIERYKDQEAVMAHSSSPAFKAFGAKVPELLGGRPEIIQLEEIQSLNR